jgi:uncharacterized protein (TIGR02246 family)
VGMGRGRRVRHVIKEDDKQAILAIIERYEQAFEQADADLMASLFWHEDPRFIEVENHIAEPFGQARYLAILDWMRKNQQPGWKMKFKDTQVFELGPEVAYTVSMRDVDQDGDMSSSRVSLVFLKKASEWRIIHGHFSNAPE